MTEGNIRKIDFEIGLLALEKDIKIGGAENKKAYSGFSVRVKLPEDVKFSGPKGAVEPIRIPVDAGKWINMTGSFVESQAPSGIVMLCHKSTPGYPQKWILRKKGSMQNPVFPGQFPILLPTDKPMILRYRLILHKGQISADDINEQLKLYNSEVH
ncbi:MAG: DUF6807 family protein [Planctomycetota bacterium]